MSENNTNNAANNSNRNNNDDSRNNNDNGNDDDTGMPLQQETCDNTSLIGMNTDLALQNYHETMQFQHKSTSLEQQQSK